MCQMRVVVEDNGVEEVVVENVTRLTVTGSTIEMETFFEAPLRLDGVSLRRMDFLDGKVVLEKNDA